MVCFFVKAKGQRKFEIIQAWLLTARFFQVHSYLYHKPFCHSLSFIIYSTRTSYQVFSEHGINYFSCLLDGCNNVRD
jgi:hypothetical protein